MEAPRRSPHDDIGSYPESPSRESTPPTSMTFPSSRQFRRGRPMLRVKRQTDKPSRNGLTGSIDLTKKLTPNQFDNNKNGNSSSMQSQKNGTMNGQNGQPNPNQNANPFFLCPQCFIRDNDPHVNYMGAWTLNGTQQMTQHSTTLSGSSIFLKFNGSGIVVFGTVPASNATNPPPTAVYSLDNKPFETTLPFAISDVQSQPLFASMGGLSNEEHQIVVNVTAASTVPYIFESFFVFPTMGSNKDVIGQIPTSVDVFPTNTATNTATSTPTASTSTPSLQAASPDTAHTAYDPQKIIRVLASLLGALVFLLVGAIVAYAIIRRRLAKRGDTEEKVEKDTIYTRFTSTDSILWSPFRSPRSLYSRSEGRAGQLSTQSTSLRTSTIDNVPHPPPLPPKPALLLPSPTPR